MNANFPQPDQPASDAPVEERLAKLTGFNDQLSQQTVTENGNASSSSLPPLLSDEDLEEQITRHSFASSPLSKLVFVAGTVFVAVFLTSLFLSQFQSPGEYISANRPAKTKDSQKSPLLSNHETDKEKAELLSELALREQQEHLRNLEAQKAKKPEPLKAKPTLKPAPRPVVRHRPPTPSPRTIPVRRQPPPRPLPNPRPAAIVRPAAPAPRQDPTQVWVQLAQVGSFGGASSVSNLSNPGNERSVPSYEPKPPSPRLVNNPSLSEGTAVQQPSPAFSSNFHTVPFGQSVSAILETTIAWEGSRSSRTGQLPDDRYLVTLSSPLKDKFGNPEIPAGSHLVVRLDSRSNALVNLTAESITANGVETKLPQGALKIRGMGHEPLIAEVAAIGGDGIDTTAVLADVLSIAGDFADIPGSRSISPLYRTLSGGTTRRRTGTAVRVFFLREGTPLEVFVNKTFSLDVREKPLELDLEAIQSEREIPQPTAEEWEPATEVVPTDGQLEDTIAFESTEIPQED
ncbi:MAG: hypothetical protein AB4426_14515 [Xenococcaceae cyanobacterium]